MTTNPSEAVEKNWNSPSRLVGMQTGIATLEINMENPHKPRLYLTYDSAITTAWPVPKGLNILHRRYLFSHIHCCPIHDSQEMEAT